MDDTVAEIGGEYLSYFGFRGSEEKRARRMVSPIFKFLLKLYVILFRIYLVFERIDSITLLLTAIEISGIYVS